MTMLDAEIDIDAALPSFEPYLTVMGAAMGEVVGRLNEERKRFADDHTNFWHDVAVSYAESADFSNWWALVRTASQPAWVRVAREADDDEFSRILRMAEERSLLSHSTEDPNPGLERHLDAIHAAQFRAAGDSPTA